MDRSRRILLCRLGFVLFCILPTTVVAGWIISRGGTPAVPKAEWERELTSRLGLVVEIGEVSYPTVDTARLWAVKTIDPETEQLVADAAMIEVAKTSSGWTVEAAGLSLDADGLPALCQSIRPRLLASHAPIKIKWLPDDVIIKGGTLGSGQTLAQLSAALECDPADSRLTLAFELPGQAQGSEPIRIQAARTREQPGGTSQWRFDTAGQSLPCSLAAAIVPELAGIGRNCEFRGELFATRGARGLRVELAGTFEGVDLDSVVTENFPHQFSGVATVAIERAVFEGGKLVEMRGRVQAERGTISTSLVVSAQEHLKVEAGRDVAELAAASIAFTKLAVGFELSGAWLSLEGVVHHDQQGVLLANGSGPLLTAPAGHAVTSAGLIRTLLSDSPHQVPATRQTAALVRLLPLPEVVPGTRTMPSHTPTRLAPAAAETEAAVRQPVLR